MAEENDHSSEEERIESRAAEHRGSILPFGLAAVALLLYFAFQFLNLMIERGNLLDVKASQEGAIQEAQKIQAQFKTLVSRTSDLASQGHPGAKMVMESLQAQPLGAPPPMPSMPAK